MLPDRRRGAAVHRAAAREGPAAAPGRRAAEAGASPTSATASELAAAAPACPVALRSRRARSSPPIPRRAADLADDDPCLITFTAARRASPRPCVHGQRYLRGQRVQAEHWLGARAGRPRLVHGRERLVEVGAQRLHRAVDPRRRRAAARRALRSRGAPRAARARARQRALHGADGVPRHRQARAAAPAADGLRGLVAAGEALNPEVLHAWHEATGLWIRDGYGQTETGQTTGMPLGEPARPGSMGRPLPGVRLWVDDGELVADPSDRPDVLPRLPRRGAARPRRRPWRTGDRVTPGRGRLPVLRGPRRRRDHLRRLPDRPVRGRVGARVAPRGRRGRGGRGARRRARRGRARGRRAARRLRGRATRSRASCRTTSRRRPRPTSTRGSSTSRPSCPRRRQRQDPPRRAADRAGARLAQSRDGARHP